jgi:hypothetical protein
MGDDVGDRCGLAGSAALNCSLWPCGCSACLASSSFGLWMPLHFLFVLPTTSFWPQQSSYVLLQTCAVGVWR